MLVAAATLPHLLVAYGNNPTLSQTSVDEINDVIAELSERPDTPDGLMGLKSVMDKVVIV